MTRFAGATLIAFASLSIQHVSPSDAPASVMDSLVETEREFARAARASGWRAAFLDYFADDAVAFTPAPVPAKPRLRLGKARPFTEEELTWEPRTGDVAASGDLGWLTGPSTFIDHTANTPPSYGNYVTVWKRDAGGRWLNYIDLGTPVPQPVPFEPGFTRMRMPDRYTTPTTAQEAKASLMEQERQLNAAIAILGSKAAYARVIAPGARLHRKGSGTMPAVGAAEIADWFTRHPARVAAATTGGSASAAGDLGYTYGTYSVGPTGGEGAYVRVWARAASGAWLLQVDVIAPPRS